MSDDGRVDRFEGLSDEDRELLKRWEEGPGKRPTAEDAVRWMKASRDGDYPRVKRFRMGYRNP